MTKLIVSSDTKIVKGYLDGLQRRLTAIDADLPTIMASVCLHVVEHGDTSLATRFADMVQNGHTRGNAIKAVMQERCPIKWVKAERISKDKVVPAQFKVDKDAMPEHKAKLAADRDAYIAALLVPFWETKKDSERDTPFNLPKILATAHKRAAAKVKAGLTDKDDLHGLVGLERTMRDLGMKFDPIEIPAVGVAEAA